MGEDGNKAILLQALDGLPDRSPGAVIVSGKGVFRKLGPRSILVFENLVSDVVVDLFNYYYFCSHFSPILLLITSKLKLLSIKSKYGAFYYTYILTDIGIPQLFSVKSGQALLVPQGFCIAFFSLLV